MKKNFKKIIVASTISLLVLPMIYSTVEPEIVQAATAQDDIAVTLVVGSGISITHPADVVMSPDIGISANSSIGSATWSVVSNNTNGYTIGFMASTSPALKSGSNSFADYTEPVNGTPVAWSVASGDKEFGFSAYGTNVSTTTWGTGGSCGSGGTPVGTMKYVGFETTNQIVGQQATPTGAGGVNTTVCLAAQQNGVYAPSGTYTATITATATEL